MVVLDAAELQNRLVSTLVGFAVRTSRTVIDTSMLRLFFVWLFFHSFFKIYGSNSKMVRDLLMIFNECQLNSKIYLDYIINND